MSWRGLLLFRMDYPCRLLSDVAVHKETDAEKDERNTEPLSHIQYHILFEAHLRLLDEFDEETHAETSDEEGSDEESSVKSVEPVFIHEYLEDSEEDTEHICSIVEHPYRFLYYGI